MNLNNLTIEEAHKGLVNKDFTSVDLTKACLDAIREKDEKLNAFITVTEDAAFEAAEAADKKIKDTKVKTNILTGIPIAIKDNILVEGVKATSGSKILKNYVATYDATVIQKLKAAGAVILGKTNMDEFAMGSSGENSAFGTIKNPHDLTRVPGGSSSGSVVSVASNQTICALGSDTGGSVRQPSAFCGIVGFKPTYGAVSRHGLAAMASGFDQIGPVTKTVRDAAYLYEAIAGENKFDSTSVKQKVDVVSSLDQDLKGKKIGLPKEFFIKELDPKVKEIVEKAAKKLESLGCEIKQVSLPRLKYSIAAYYILILAEVSSNMARYDGVRYGFRAEAGNLLETYLKTRGQGLGEEVSRRIMLGTYVLSAGYNDQYYKKAQKVRRLIKEDFEKVYQDVDVILAPTTPTTAFKLGEKTNDPLTMYLEDVFTVPANVAGLPAISVPGGKIDKLPVGIQLFGQHFKEADLLNIANQLEKNLA
jgi:aspartyl-tRNA(Asn)/glutamyl-tRNA(Gln) amidotransferase subunit A